MRFPHLIATVALNLVVSIGIPDVAVPCVAGDPTARINSQIAAAWKAQEIQPAPQCSDQQFVRRVYLDLVGRVPSRQEIQTFLDDTRESKRQALVDQLLDSEDHAQHFSDLFDALLMGRAKEHVYDQRVAKGWRRYLESVFRENRPWDEVAREVLIARPVDEASEGAVWFLYERNNNHQAIAEAVAPAFFGIRIECAQCHDHMMVDEIEQSHYWGLVAFFNRSENKDTPNGPRIAESAVGGFSEFANLEGSSTPNFLTFLNAPTVDEERPGNDEKTEDSDNLYVAAEIPEDPREPVFSRRKKFVTEVLDGHPLLARSMVNRVWALLMGRGIVHPFDEIDSMHPPSHPDLLQWLSDDYAASGYNTRRLIRSIVNSDAYQLSSKRPSEAISEATFAWYLERPLTAEQLARSIQFTLRGSFQNDASVVKTLRQQILNVRPDAIEVPIGDALFFSNEAQLDRFIRESNREGNLLHQAMSCDTDTGRADLLIETFFGRPASGEERSAVADYLADRSDRIESALAQVAWSLITSAEFRFNH